MGHAYGQGRSEETGWKLSAATTGRPTQTGKTGVSEADINIFERGPGRWSYRETSSKPPSDTQKQEKERLEKSRKSDPTFQRRWSFRTPSVNPNKKSSDLSLSFQAPTIASLSRSCGESIPEYIRGPCNISEQKQESSSGKYPSQYQSHLNRTSSSSLTAFNSRSTPSFSTSSIQSKVSIQNKKIYFDNFNYFKSPRPLTR